MIIIALKIVGLVFGSLVCVNGGYALAGGEAWRAQLFCGFGMVLAAGVA